MYLCRYRRGAAIFGAAFVQNITVRVECPNDNTVLTPRSVADSAHPDANARRGLSGFAQAGVQVSGSSRQREMRACPRARLAEVVVSVTR